MDMIYIVKDDVIIIGQYTNTVSNWSKTAI